MVNIVLYDAPSAAPEAWAPNIWRVRFILNYKRLPYRTVWVEFHDVERASRAVNAPPISISRDGRPIYTLPVLIDSRSQSNTVVLTSPNVIAEYLEVTYPARPIFPPGSRALQSVFVQYLNEVVLQPLLPIMVPLSYGRLPPRAQAHFQGLSGMPGYMVAGPQRDQAWAAVRDRLDQLSAMLDKNSGADGDGTVAMGHELSHADFAICSVLVWIERVSPNDGWVRIRQWSGGRWARLWERCSPFMEVQ